MSIFDYVKSLSFSDTRRLHVECKIIFEIKGSASPNIQEMAESIIKVDSRFPWKDEHFVSGKPSNGVAGIVPPFGRTGQLVVNDCGHRTVEFTISYQGYSVTYSRLYAYQKYATKLAEEIAYEHRLVGIDSVRAIVCTMATQVFASQRPR